MLNEELSSAYNAYYHYKHMSDIRALQLKIEALESIVFPNTTNTDSNNYNAHYENALKNDKDYTYLKSMADGYAEKLNK